MQLTPEEEARVLAGRASVAQDEDDRRALEAILHRAKSTAERRALEKMIHARGGPEVRTCRCGQPASPVTGTLRDCEDCCARAYGK